MTEWTGSQMPVVDPDPDNPKQGMSAQTAARVEFGIIGLAIVALLLIFQPLSLALFGVGCGIVVVSALANNLLPLCRPGIPVRSLVKCSLIVAGIFIAVLILAVASAYVYGRVFVG